MTTNELRSLLERVEAHGGPVAFSRGRVSIPRLYCVVAHEPWGETDEHILVWGETDERILVGVLKRDLIERGAVEVFSGSVLMHDPQRDGLYGFAEVSFPQQLDPHYECHDSELEAVLRAWLAAAEAEGWAA